MLRQQRVRRGDADTATGAGFNEVHRLDAVVEHRACGRFHQRCIVAQREQRHIELQHGSVEDLGGGAHGTRTGVDDGRVPRHALAHRGSGADDVEGAGLEARQDLVEVGEAGGGAGDAVAALEGLLQLVERQGQQVAEGSGGIHHAVLGHLEHLGLGLVERLGDIVGLEVGQLGDLAGHADEPAQHRRVLHDLGVAAGVGDGRRGVLQLQQRLRTTDLLDQPVAAQLIGDRHDVDRLATGHQATDGRVDVLVRRFVEVLDVHPHLRDLADDLARQQQRAQQALFSAEVVGWHPAVAAGWLAIAAGVT